MNALTCAAGGLLRYSIQTIMFPRITDIVFPRTKHSAILRSAGGHQISLQDVNNTKQKGALTLNAPDPLMYVCRGIKSTNTVQWMYL